MGRSRARRGRSKWVLRSLAVGALVLIGVLYFKPVRSYFETRSALTDRAAEVHELRRQRAALRRQLAASTSLVALGKEARRLGFVKPGERLFIVKGIPAWRKRSATIAGRERG